MNLGNNANKASSRMGKILQIGKKVLGVSTVAGLGSFYFYKKHMYELEMFNQINKVCSDKSGIFIQQRQAFPSLWFIQWLIPYHQSLKIVDKKTGKIRHIGLGQRCNPTGYTDRTCEFVHHEGSKFDWLNRFEVSIPIEVWVPYKRKYGYFPQERIKIDPDILNAITRCSNEEHLLDELKKKGIYNNLDFDIKRYQTKFLATTFNDEGDSRISTCQTAVMDALRLSEKLTEKSLKENDKT